MVKDKNKQRKIDKKTANFPKKGRYNQNGYALVYWVVIILLISLLGVFWFGVGWLDKRMNSLEKKQTIDQSVKNNRENINNSREVAIGEQEKDLSQEEETETSTWEEYAQEETAGEVEETEAEAVSATTDNNASADNSSEEPQTASSTALNVTEESGSGSSQSDSNNSSNSVQNSSQGFSESPELFYLEEGIITSYYIKDKSITKEDVARRSITHTLLHSNAVTTRIIKDHTITKDDLAKDLEIKTSGDVEAGDLTVDEVTATDLTATNLAATSAVFTAVATNSISIGGTDIGDIYLAKAGGTMTGALILAGDPSANLEAATKQYVDTQVATADTFLELTDTISTYNTGRILFETGSAVTDSSNLTFSSDILSTPNLGVSGDAAISGDVTLAGLSGAGATNNVLVVDGSGNIDYQAIDSRVWGTSSLVDGSGVSANYIAVWSDGDTITTGGLYDASGDIGIGTTSVNAKLELNSGTSGVSGLRFTQFTNNSASIANPTSKVLSVDSEGDVILVDDDTGSGSLPSGTLNGQTLRYNGSGWVTSNTLFNDGTDVGIGTTGPGAKLDVRGGINAGTNGTEFTVSTAGVVTGGTYNGQTISSAANFTGTLTIADTLTANGAVVLGDSGDNVTINSDVWDISAAGAATGLASVTASGALNGGSLTDGTLTITGGAITGATGITSSGTITFTGLSGDTDNTILILNSSNQIATREIDSHVWGGALIDGSGTAGYVAYWSDADTLTAEQYLSVSRGGTGVGTLTEGGILYGNGTGAIQATSVLTNGQLLIGDGTGAPTAATLTGTSNQITVANGAGSITLSTPQDIATTSTPQFARLGIGTAAHASDILTILSTSTTDTSKGLNISHTGAITGTGYGGYFSKTGASTTNVGLYATASGATNNYAAIFEAGNVGIGTTAPITTLDVRGGINAGTNGTEFTVSTAGAVTGASFTDGTLTISSGNITGANDITATGTITGGTLTDGTFTVTGGVVTAGTWQGTVIGTLYGGTNWNSSSSSGIVQVNSGSWGVVNGTANYAARWTDANTLGIGVIYDDGTNVGIGTDNPTKKLVINDGGMGLTAQDAQTQRAYFPPLGTMDNDGIYFSSSTASADNQAIGGIFLKRRDFNDAPGTSNDLTEKVGLWIGGFYQNSGTSKLPIYLGGRLYDTDKPAMAITQDAKVGIGTTIPDYELVVADSSSDSGIRIEGATDGDSFIKFTENGSAQAYLGYDASEDVFKINGLGGLSAYSHIAINSSGNVGIGTADPQRNLDVLSATGSTIGVGSSDNVATGSDFARIDFIHKSATYTESTQPFARISALRPISGAAGDLIFHTLYTSGDLRERMRIDRYGNVGIGSTSPEAPLNILTTADEVAIFESSDENSVIRIQNDVNSGYSQLRLGTDNSDNAAYLIAYGSTHSSQPDKLALKNTFGDIGLFTGTSGASYERVTIDTSGNVGINRTSSLSAKLHIETADSTNFMALTSTGNQSWNFAARSGTSAVDYIDINTGGSTIVSIEDTGNVGINDSDPAYKLEVGGDVNTTAGGYLDSGSCVAGTCSSDIRLKNNIQELSSSLDKVLQLKPSTFEFKDSKYGSTDTNYGLIAQEVEGLFPEWVINDDDGYKKIRYGQNIQMNFLKAFQEYYALTEPLIDSFDISGNQIVAKDFLNATADGLSTKVINDPINGVTDDDFQVSPANLNGAMAIDSANGRLYFRYADNWHYVNQTGGFQIPNYETAPATQLNSKARKSKKESLAYESSAYDDYLTEKLMPGDFLIPYVDEYLPDGAVHGLYARFSDVKGKMFKEEQEKLDSLVTLADSNLQSISDLETAIDENFSLVGGRLDELEERLEDLEWQATNNEEAIEGLTTRQGELEAGQTDLAAEQSELAARQSALEALLNGGAESNLGSSGLTENGLEFLPQFLSADDEGVLTLGADTLVQGKLTATAIETQTMASQQVTTEDMAAKSVQTDDIRLSKTTSGVGTIEAGETEFIVETDKAGKENYIYLSPVSSTFGKDLYLDDIKEGESFKVKLSEPEEPLDEDITFNWLIILGQ